MDSQILKERVGTNVVPVPHWVTGRSGSVFIVERPAAEPRTVYKWVPDDELVLIRDKLARSIVPTPRLIRWWPAQAGVSAAVELEYVPQIAAAEPTYHFAPAAIPFSKGDWMDAGLDELLETLAKIHKVYRADCDGLRPTSPAEDLADLERSLSKLKAVTELPDGERWYAFWVDRSSAAKATFDVAHAMPATWLWFDAKWDHVGRRSDGSLVFLEWSDRSGPGASDLFFLLFLEKARRDRLIDAYVRIGAVDPADVRHALLRSCFLHGPSLACLSIRGVTPGGSPASDREAWSAEAATVAKVIEELSG